MSGRPKTEAEDLRQLIREAHEAMKDLRLAIKEIRAERAEHLCFLDQSIRLAVDAANEQIHNHAQQVLDFIQAETAKVADHIAGILGAGSGADLVNEIVGEAGQNLAHQLMLAVDDDCQVVIRPKPHGEVFVTTDPALAPPGSIILDAR